jgi:predicted AlkP superfamily phosphohydrolase/phosphomutase
MEENRTNTQGSNELNSSLQNHRLMVIGLDGATFDLIKPWAEAGHLPSLARLMRDGAWGSMASTSPPHSGPAWATFSTGVNPGKHGIYHFAGATRDENYFRPLSADSIQCRYFWDFIGDQGRTVGVVNVPLTYPPRPVNGYMISGLFAPDGPSAFYSRELYEEIVSQCGEYIVSAPVLQNRRAFLDALLHGMSNGLQVAEYLIEHHPTDLFIIVFRMIDSVMHRYWVDMDPHHPLHTGLGDAAIPDAILWGYQLLDKAIGRLMDRAGSNTTFVVMSDHGFCGVHRRLAVNQWLRDKGLLKLKSHRAALIGLAEMWAERLKLEMFFKRASKRALKLMGVKGRYEGWLYQTVDWARTKVVYGPTQGLNINLKGRDFHGTVKPEEYEPLRDWLIQELKDIRDPESGYPVLRALYRPEEIYSGDALHLAPDLTFELAEYETNGQRWAYGIAPSFSKWHTFVSPSRRQTGEHALNGIFLAYGPHIRNGHYPDLHISDLAPTIMYRMGLAVPRHMDGEVRTEIFEPAFSASHPVQYVNLDHTDIQTDHQALADNYDNLVTERLRELGYID